MPLGPLGDALMVDDYAAIAACALLAFGIVSYVSSPRKLLFPLAYLQYVALLSLVGYLMYTTGGASSSFIALWLMVVIFASVFGVIGQSTVLVFAMGYAAYLISQTSEIPVEPLVIIGLVTVLPLIASYILFHKKAKTETSEDRSYHALASELNQVNTKADVVIHAIDDGVIALNSKGVIELINPAAQRIIGWGKGDAVGLDYKSVLKLSDKQDQPLTETNDPVYHVLSNNQAQHSKDFIVMTTGNKRKNLSIVASPIGQVGQGAIIVFRDITNEQAEEREQAEFISTASHEMRTPVASIEGYLGLALNPNTAQIDAKAHEYITKAHESAQHLGRLFQDLLDVSKADDGRLSNHPKVVDVIAYTGDIVEGLQPKAKEKGLRLFYKPAPNGDESVSDSRVVSPIYYAHIDQDHYREVMANLVENAIKYTLQGDVIVDVSGEENKVRISIQDSGIGIPEEDISHLFQKFYRVDNSSTREIGGTGLGLYLCRRLTEVMGGRIWVESEFQKGSTFYLELPRLERQEALHMIDQASVEPASIQPSQSSHQAPPPLHPVAETTQQDKPNVSFSSSPRNISPIQPASLQPTVQPIQPKAAPTIAAIEQNPQQHLANTRRTDSGFSVPERPNR